MIKLTPLTPVQGRSRAGCGSLTSPMEPNTPFSSSGQPPDTPEKGLLTGQRRELADVHRNDPYFLPAASLFLPFLACEINFFPKFAPRSFLREEKPLKTRGYFRQKYGGDTECK